MRMDEDAAPGLLQQTADRFCLGQFKKGIAPEVFGEMNNGGVDGLRFGLVEVHIIITPVVRKVGADENDIAGLEAFDVIADKLGAAPLMKEDQFHFDMVVPAVIDERVPVFPHAKGVGWDARDFEKFGSHDGNLRI